MKNQEGSPPPSSNPVQMEKNSDDTDGSRFRLQQERKRSPFSVVAASVVFWVCL
ncbi:hypothetical protein ES288_A10G223300v1 [Gossypium darwinii]|uniref:Uncharacterized protein n=1 Tax=Gossypium darwinii TaxID=34276 RepID=A0A5D2F532_GOSDA|nr:hypothetical protein ES288_A10G223300v1 [Gossypium darwinii]